MVDFICIFKKGTFKNNGRDIPFQRSIFLPKILKIKLIQNNCFKTSFLKTGNFFDI